MAKWTLSYHERRRRDVLRILRSMRFFSCIIHIASFIFIDEAARVFYTCCTQNVSLLGKSPKKGCTLIDHNRQSFSGPKNVCRETYSSPAWCVSRRRLFCKTNGTHDNLDAFCSYLCLHWNRGQAPQAFKNRQIFTRFQFVLVETTFNGLEHLHNSFFDRTETKQAEEHVEELCSLAVCTPQFLGKELNGMVNFVPVSSKHVEDDKKLVAQSRNLCIFQSIFDMVQKASRQPVKFAIPNYEHVGQKCLHRTKYFQAQVLIQFFLKQLNKIVKGILYRELNNSRGLSAATSRAQMAN
mmetsp:Transcript_4785/g.14419  ORF Transcript_4785/g.14419 Transcript_4785/m.14419 type:complete len:296 (-) Transcript_4785:583-1470(-)